MAEGSEQLAPREFNSVCRYWLSTTPDAAGDTQAAGEYQQAYKSPNGP
ncbi:MAG TPA: hypothetical protein VHV32_08315 [Candidatus Angelobacter sp.]|nr:hypothetical protein [Candidatus Angelobacter sp.]